DQPGDRREAGLRRADRGTQAPLDPRLVVAGGIGMNTTSSLTDDTLTPELIEVLEAVCDRFERAWKAGGRPSLEDHLAAMPAAGRLVLFQELMALELSYRRRAGERPEPDEYRARFPAWGAAVGASFGDLPAQAE